MQNHFYLSLGGNLSPEIHLREAVRLLKSYGRLLAVSSVYETPAFGVSEPQPNYLNAAVHMISDLSPLQFQRTAIANIEKQLGRVRTSDKFAARTIDIDIMLVNAEVLEIEHRRIPSDEILERVFVAVPLAEIAPDYVHPVVQRTLSEIAARFDPSTDQMQKRPEIDLIRP